MSLPKWLSKLLGGALAVAFTIWLMWSAMQPQPRQASGNPRDLKVTNEEFQKQAAYLAERARLRSLLADEVKAQQMSFEEAGCVYRGDDWDVGGTKCLNTNRH